MLRGSCTGRLKGGEEGRDEGAAVIAGVSVNLQMLKSVRNIDS